MEGHSSHGTSNIGKTRGKLRGWLPTHRLIWPLGPTWTRIVLSPLLVSEDCCCNKLSDGKPTETGMTGFGWIGIFDWLEERKDKRVGFDDDTIDHDDVVDGICVFPCIKRLDCLLIVTQTGGIGSKGKVCFTETDGVVVGWLTKTDGNMEPVTDFDTKSETEVMGEELGKIHTDDILVRFTLDDDEAKHGWIGKDDETNTVDREIGIALLELHVLICAGVEL